MNKFWYLGIIVIDVLLTNVHQFWNHATAELQWYVWDVSQAARVCLIPIVMLLQKKLDKFGEVVVMNYVAFSVLDLIQTASEKNSGIQIEELFGFILLNLLVILRWNKL